MKKFRFLIYLLITLFVSCASSAASRGTSGTGLPSERISLPQQITPSLPGPSEMPPERITPVPPEKPEPPKNIMGEGKVNEEILTLFFENNSPWTDPAYIRLLLRIYIEESAVEGVNHDIAFVQMCLETGFLNYGGLVKPEWYNFCGLGAIGPEQPGLIFPDPRTGVRAHIQHLKAYGSEEPLNSELVDPRFRYVRRGSSPTIEGLAGTWASDRAYGTKLNNILKRLYEFAF